MVKPVLYFYAGKRGEAEAIRMMFKEMGEVQASFVPPPPHLPLPLFSSPLPRLPLLACNTPASRHNAAKGLLMSVTPSSGFRRGCLSGGRAATNGRRRAPSVWAAPDGFLWRSESGGASVFLLSCGLRAILHPASLTLTPTGCPVTEPAILEHIASSAGHRGVRGNKYAASHTAWGLARQPGPPVCNPSSMCLWRFLCTSSVSQSSSHGARVNPCRYLGENEEERSTARALCSAVSAPPRSQCRQFCPKPCNQCHACHRCSPLLAAHWAVDGRYPM